MSSSNADSTTVASSVDPSQRGSDAGPRRPRNGETNITSIIDLLTQTPTLEKEEGKDHPWKEVALELVRRLRNVPRRKIESQEASIAKDVQELKASVQLLNKQLQTQGNTRSTSGTSSWADVARGGVTTGEQRPRDGLPSLRKGREILVKIAERKEVEEIQKKSANQIFQGIESVSAAQRDLIVSLRKLGSGDVALHAVSPEARAALEKSQEWAKGIAGSAHVVRRSFAILAHDVRITLDTSNQKTAIKRLVKDNARLHGGLEVLRIAWSKKVVGSGKAHSSLIVEVATETMANRLLDVGMLDSYQKCSCELFDKNCRITQCYRCFGFGHMTRFCKNEERCSKCAGKHHIKGCVVPANRRRCANCNGSHEPWRRSCPKWKIQAKQSEEIFRNRPVRYSEASRHNRSPAPFSLNFLGSMNSGSMNLGSTNPLSSMNVSTATSSRDVDEPT